MKLLLVLLVCVQVLSQHENWIRFFEREDTDHDGILTTFQFIEGLISAFGKSNYEKNMQNINDFGREFAGRKLTKGFLRIQDIQSWFLSNEIFEAYQDWLYIIEEGENHHSSFHVHKRPESLSKRPSPSL